MNGEFKPSRGHLGRLVEGAPPVGADWSARAVGQFVAGTSSGASLLHAIYDEVLSEPVPARLSTIMKDEPED